MEPGTERIHMVTVPGGAEGDRRGELVTSIPPSAAPTEHACHSQP